MSRSKKAVLSAIAYIERALPPESMPGENVVEPSYADTPVMKDLQNGFLVAYLADEGSAYGYIQYRDLESSGVSEKELHAAGLENLSAVADERLRVQPYGDIFALLMGGTFEASMLLLDRLWNDSFREYVQGTVLVAVPARDVLAFGSASSPAAVRGLHAVVDRLVQAGGAELSTTLYRREGSAWLAHDA
jgi:uncharacterized protein DUF1444